MKTATAIKIDPEFKALIPPLSKEEREQLELNIKADGCRDPLVLWCGTLIDGHNRHEICERHDIDYAVVEHDFKDRDEAKAWIIQNQFGRRNLTVFARGELALKLEPLIAARAKEAQRDHSGTAPGKKSLVQKSAQVIDERKTRAKVAKLAGVSHDTIAKVKYIQQNADEETKERLRTDKDMKVHRVAKDIKEKKQRAARTEARVTAAAMVEAKPDERIVIGDFRKNADKVADGSLNLIFTDPPYDREAAKMLPKLAEFAAAKLADGGSLICYVGHVQIPEAIQAFKAHLRYWWVIACVHSGGETMMREYGIKVGWKAVLWFVKGSRHDNGVIVSDVMSGGREKSHHDWQQAQSEAEYWIEKLCPRDGIVCDPFLGGGTTAAAAKKLGRKWIGFEVDPETAKIAAGRVA
jgi:16S rRNA G966 N2-methylase RsmD